MSETHMPSDFGRVDPDGTVYVRIGQTERSVGQVPDVTPDEAMEFFTRRFASLETEVALLVTRVSAQAMSPEDATRAIAAAKQNVTTANAVGDLASLEAKLVALEGLLPAQREAKRQAKAEQQAETLSSKQAMVAEAESLAEGTDWRGGVDRFRTLLEEWKALPRMDKATDNELWHRFSSARTTYTRRRKAHFAEVNSRRDEAKRLKEQIIAEAEPLAGSTDWGATSGAFRDLMARWREAGSARRADDESLWTRFRAIQDQFFNARTAAQSAVDGEQSENLTAKTALLEAVIADLDGVGDVDKAKALHREFLAKFNELGHVPRAAIRDLDARVRKVGDQVAQLEAEEWKRTDPEARKRAEDTVALFQSQVDKLTRDLADAEAKGDSRAAKDAGKSLETYTSWLNQAKDTLADFSR
ncbi:MAG: DUF349 domain-containing protein [Arachnia sp.]